MSLDLGDLNVLRLAHSPISTNVVITSAVFPASVTFDNANGTYTVSASGTGISGATSLVKTNSGSLTLNSANAYSGGTAIKGGTLLVNNTNGSGTGSGAVTVASGGTLSG